jgi:hypothetical protein
VATGVVQILRSYTANTPDTLIDGQLAYSYVSDSLFIGDSNNAIYQIGGNNITGIVNAATTANTPSTLVFRDSSSHISASIDGGRF